LVFVFFLVEPVFEGVRPIEPPHLHHYSTFLQHLITQEASDLSHLTDRPDARLYSGGVASADWPVSRLKVQDRGSDQIQHGVH